MNTTPQAVKVLAAALESHGWDQNDLARQAQVSRAVVSFHFTGSRPIRDDHLAQYAAALDKHEQSMLVSAWLRDCLPDTAAANVLDPYTQSLAEEVKRYQPSLTTEQQAMLDWWAAKLAADTELAHIFAAITRKAGWQE